MGLGATPAWQSRPSLSLRGGEEEVVGPPRPARTLQGDGVTAPKRDRTLTRWMRVAPFLLAGPISGPLLAGAVFNAREGRPVLATLYAIAFAEVSVLLPYIVACLGLKVL
jgi:hypothetical protein